MSIRTKITRLSYAVEITVKQFINIENRDESRLLHSKTLLELLQNKGAFDIEYNGHFGPYIFYNIRTEDDRPELRKEIEKMIVCYANGNRMDC